MKPKNMPHIPDDYVTKKPNARSICFADRYLSLSAISRDTDIPVSTLSRIFSGQYRSGGTVMRVCRLFNIETNEEFLDLRRLGSDVRSGLRRARIRRLERSLYGEARTEM